MESTTPYRSLRPGEMLNWYRIERILGRGGFGVIYLATDTNLAHQVAIKEYIPKDVAHRDSDSRVLPITEKHGDLYRWGLERFIKEARNLVRFKHPNIVRVMSVFQQNNTAYMVMEFEEGVDVRTYLKQHSGVDEIALRALIMPVIKGLGEVHRHGFIHRDIKPANILMRKNGSPVLLDFGSARNATRYTASQMTALVSAGYAPLEQYNSDADEQQGPWTDIYAIGGVLYFAVTGRDPVDSTQRGSALLNGGKDPQIPASVLMRGRYSAAFLYAIDWALRFRIADRPQSLKDWVPALLAQDIDPALTKLDLNTGDTGKPTTGVGCTYQDSEFSDATILSARQLESPETVAPDEDPFADFDFAQRPKTVPKVSSPRNSQSARKPLMIMLVVAGLAAGVYWYTDQQNQRLARERAASDALRLEAIARAEQAEQAMMAIREAEAERIAAAKLASADAERLQREAAQAAAAAAAEREAQQAIREVEAASRLKRRFEAALREADTALDDGRLPEAANALTRARVIGLSDSRLTELSSRLTRAQREQRIPVSDADFENILHRFNALRRAIEKKDSSTINAMTERSNQNALFEQLNARFDKLNMEITGIRVRNADKSISATLRIQSMVRENGDRAIPSTAYRDREIVSSRINGQWSAIRW